MEFYNKYKNWIWGAVIAIVLIIIIVIALRWWRKRQQAALDKAEKDSPVSFDHIQADLEKRAATEKLMLMADTLELRLKELEGLKPLPSTESNEPQAPQAPQTAPQVEPVIEQVDTVVSRSVDTVKVDAVEEVVTKPVDNPVIEDSVKPVVSVVSAVEPDKGLTLDDYLFADAGVSSVKVKSVVEPVSSIDAVMSDKQGHEFNALSIEDEKAFERANKLNSVISWTHFISIVKVRLDLKDKAVSYLEAAKKAKENAKGQAKPVAEKPTRATNKRGASKAKPTATNAKSKNKADK